MLLRFFHLLETDKKYHENMPFMEGNIVFIEVFKQYWRTEDPWTGNLYQQLNVSGRADLSHWWLCKGVQLLQNVNVLFCTVKYFLSATDGVIVTTWKSLLPRYWFSIQVAHLAESNQGEKMDILFKQSAFSPCRMSPHHQKWWIQQCGTISGAGVLCKEEKLWDPPCGYDSYHNNPPTTDVIQS